MAKISIIVPVYNVEKYLDECLKSVVGQTFQDIEIICINDGSTDDSKKILDTYAAVDNRIKVLNQPNCGLAAARFAGILVATGDYLMFVDSDDSIDEATCYTLMEMMTKYRVDILGYSYKTFPNGQNKPYSMKTDVVLTPRQLLCSTRKPQSSNDLCFVWRYLISRHVITENKINFNKKVRIGEDMIFIMEVFSKAKSVYLTNYAPYNYRTNNQNSLMHEMKYNPYLEESFSIMYDTKKRLIKENSWDDITPFSLNLAEYTIKQYFRIFLRNYRAKGKSVEQSIRDVLKLPMIQDALNVIGYRNVYSNWKEYALFLCMKFQMVSVLKRYY